MLLKLLVNKISEEIKSRNGRAIRSPVSSAENGDSPPKIGGTMDDTKVTKDESVDTPEYRAVQDYFANITPEEFWNDWHRVQPNGESIEHQEWTDFLKDSAKNGSRAGSKKKE